MRLSFYVATLITLIAFNTQAATRSETIGVLDSMTSNWPQANLRVWLNDGEQQIQLGSKVEYHFQADQDAYLTVLHVDTLGQGTLLFPSGLETGNQLQAGVKRTFPGQREGFDLNATEPQGAENVYVIAAKHAITPEELGISIAPDEMKSLDESATMRFAKCRQRPARWQRRRRTHRSADRRIHGRYTHALYPPPEDRSAPQATRNSPPPVIRTRLERIGTGR